MMILRKTYKSIFSLSWMICLSAALQAQSIDIVSGMNELTGQVGSIYVSGFDLILYLIGIGALIGLVISVYKVYTEEHGNAWMTSAKWCGGLLLSGLGIYLVKMLIQ